MRDAGLLEAALARPQQRAAYTEPSISELAALYAHGIARSHPFIDGNKRTEFAAMVLFLSLHGLELDAPEAEALTEMLRMASGVATEHEFQEWVRAHARMKR